MSTWYSCALNELDADEAARVMRCSRGTAVVRLRQAKRELSFGLIDVDRLPKDRALEVYALYKQSSAPTRTKRPRADIGKLFAGRAAA